MQVGPMLERYCVAAFFARLEVGERFARSDWPAHVTLASNFVVSEPVEQIVSAIRDAKVVDRALRFQFTGLAFFGPRRDVPVRLVECPDIEDVHRDLAGHLGHLGGFKPDEPAHWRDGYRPHLTLRPAVDVRDGASCIASHIAIARLTGEAAEVVACFALDRSPVPKVRAVGFDLDGTLFDHHGSAADAVRNFMTELEREPTIERVTAWFELEAQHFESWRAGDLTFAEQRRLRLRDFLEFLSVVVPARDDVLDELFEKYLVDYRRAWRAFPGTEAVLENLRGRGIRIGVLTNGNHAQQIDKLNVTGLTHLIDVVCTSEDIGFAKPDPRAFEILAARLECSTSEMVFIGDNSEMDVAGARAAGIAAARVRHDDDSDAALEAALDSASL